MQVEATIEKGLLYKTVNTSIYQIDHSETFSFNFYGEEIHFKFCELINFRRKIQQIDVVTQLTENYPDIEIIRFHHCDRIVVLRLVQILELQEVLDGAFTMMKLNSVIHKEIRRKIV